MVRRLYTASNGVCIDEYGHSHGPTPQEAAHIARAEFYTQLVDTRLGRTRHYDLVAYVRGEGSVRVIDEGNGDYIDYCKKDGALVRIGSDGPTDSPAWKEAAERALDAREYKHWYGAEPGEVWEVNDEVYTVVEVEPILGITSGIQFVSVNHESDAFDMVDKRVKTARRLWQPVKPPTTGARR